MYSILSLCSQWPGGEQTPDRPAEPHGLHPIAIRTPRTPIVPHELGPKPLPWTHLYIGWRLGFRSFLFLIGCHGANIPPPPPSHLDGRRAAQFLRCSFTAHPLSWHDSISAEVRTVRLIDTPPSPPSVVAIENHNKAAPRHRMHHTTSACNGVRACLRSTPRRCGVACQTWSRSGSATSLPPRTIVVWSNLPNSMVDFPWRWPDCGDADVGVATGTQL
jgi:hypothetical protein